MLLDNATVFKFCVNYCSGSASVLTAIDHYENIHCAGFDCDYVEFIPESEKLEDGSCANGKEHPEWKEGYTYLDRFLETNKKDNNGDIVFMAISIGDYEVMSGNMQELRRYIREVQEVVVYYRNVTINDKPAVGAKVKLKD